MSATAAMVGADLRAAPGGREGFDPGLNVVLDLDLDRAGERATTSTTTSTSTTTTT